MSQAPVAIRRAPTVDLNLPVEKGDATFKLAYDFKAICLVKEKTGRSLLNGNVWESIEDDPEMILAVVWAGLQLYHPELSLDEVSHMLLPSRMDEYMSATLLAWTKVRPEKEDDSPKAEPLTEPATAQ
jgi:hypothetical protein